MSASTFDQPRSVTCAPSHAARELGLKRYEFELAVHLGRIRTVPDEGGGGGRRVERAEIDRLRAQDGFPETLRERVRFVGTAEGADLMDIPVGRFTRLARVGLLVPVRFYLNRYRAVVWLYLAEELRDFMAGAENAHLLRGRTPESLRGRLAAGVDLRARNWRGRRLGFLLRQAEDPWARAAAVAAFLPPLEIADVVKDPYERRHLNRFRPAPTSHGAPGSPAAGLAERITTAQDADEIGWLRSDLARALKEARTLVPAPRPTVRRVMPSTRTAAQPVPPMAPTVTRLAEPVARWSAPSAEQAAPTPQPDGASTSTAGSPGHGQVSLVSGADGAPASPACEPNGERRPLGRGPGGGPASSACEPDRGSASRTAEAGGGPVLRVAEWRGRPAVGPSRPPTRRDHASSPAPPEADRGLRAWLRRRNPRPAKAAQA